MRPWWPIAGTLAGLVIAAVVSGGGCGRLLDCSRKPVCKQKGECGSRTWAAGDGLVRCYVRNTDDCRQSDVCRDAGSCHFDLDISGERCVPLTVDDCRGSKGCGERGECTLVDGRCQRGADDRDPSCTIACRGRGACTRRDDQCVATSADDCANSSGCEYNRWCTTKPGVDYCFDSAGACGNDCWERGDCRWREGICTTADEGDCEAAVACKVQGRCSKVGDRNWSCAPKGGDCDDSLECKAYGRCEPKGRYCIDPAIPSDPGGYGSTKCLRDPACETEGRCLRDRDQECHTAAELGLDPWKPPPKP